MKGNKQSSSFIDIYLALARYKQLVFSHWKQILLIGLFSGLAGIIIAWLTPKTYIAEITFALEDKSAGVGMYSSLASQFGVELGKGDGGAFKGDNIIELFKSKAMVERVLLSSYSFNNKPQLLIDRYLEMNEISLDKKEFDYSRSPESFNRAQDSLLQLIGDNFIVNDLKGDKIDKKLTFIKYRFKSTDELFAKVFLTQLAETICSTFIESRTKKMKANISLLEMRIDSIKRELSNEMSNAASVQDKNQNPSVATVRVPLVKKQINIQLLTTLYGELVKNVEISKMELAKEEPIIVIIDAPKLPLKFVKKSKLLTGIVYAISIVFVYIIYLVISQLYKDFKVAFEMNIANNVV